MERKILIVDDDPEVRLGLTIRLRALGYRVCDAAGRDEAITRAQVERPDVILLDLGLRQGDGYQVMARLREHGALEDTPIVVLSGRDPAFHRQRVILEGARAFLQKPVPPGQLLDAVERAVRIRRTGQSGWASRPAA
jgi:two-component system KDP operon response regulator KdpE